MTAINRVAILGGGLGALSTAFQLTSSPDWREKYDVTVYQQGWRLGGKCASGRDPRPGYGSRIYEHGLHLFGGFYDYSFSLLRRCYDELGRPEGHPNRRYRDAFVGLDQITLMDRVATRDGFVFEPWYINFEKMPGEPGEDTSPRNVPHMVSRMVKLLGAFDGMKSVALSQPAPDAAHPLLRALHSVETLVQTTVIEFAGPIVRVVADQLQA